MTTEASRRLHLHDTARQTWGAEAADTLMELLPPEPDSLATKADVALLRSDVVAFRSSLHADMADFKAEIRADMADFKAEMGADMTDFKAQMRIEMAKSRAEIYQAFAEQTRTLVLANAGMMLTTLALSFAVARIA